MRFDRRGDGGTRGWGDGGTRGRGNAGMRGCGDAGKDFGGQISSFYPLGSHTPGVYKKLGI
ncbi:MAG: hypothetical protein KME21_19115 [Desmonostoc vinosum HA7617-LM4]|nr:hypothetical protein [Desmonostoc vinosum HA7617-LM4]